VSGLSRIDCRRFARWGSTGFLLGHWRAFWLVFPINYSLKKRQGVAVIQYFLSFKTGLNLRAFFALRKRENWLIWEGEAWSRPGIAGPPRICFLPESPRAFAPIARFSP
jgi:hypothetical protein